MNFKISNIPGNSVYIKKCLTGGDVKKRSSFSVRTKKDETNEALVAVCSSIQPI